MKNRVLCCIVLLLLGPVVLVHAEDDQDRVRAALQAGAIRPLGEVLARVTRDFPGQVLDVELEGHHDKLVYEIKLLRPDGAITKLAVDARTGEVLGHRGRGPQHMGRD